MACSARSEAAACARPSLVERVAGIEETTTATAEETRALAARLARVEHEPHPHGGTSLRDALDRVDERTTRFSPDEE
jgi:hypothetical protein